MNGSGKTNLNLPQGTNEIRICDLPGYIAGAIEPFDKINFSKGRQTEIILYYEKEFEKASMSGELVGRNPHTKIEQPLATGDQLKLSVIFVDDLREYLSKFSIIVDVLKSPAESGRYTLEEAAICIATATGGGETLLLKKLGDAVSENLIPVHGPGSNIPYQPSTPRDFYEEVYWDDLNQWMELGLPRMSWRFPPPTNDIEIDCAKTSKNHKNKQSHAKKTSAIKSISELFPKLPQRQDDWCKLIIEMVCKYKNQHGAFPSRGQIWSTLRDNPPDGYVICNKRDRGGEDALFMGGKSLSRSALSKRWSNWTK